MLMRITRNDLFQHVKKYESTDDFTGFLGFIDRPIRELRVKKIPNGRIRLHYIDDQNNIQRVDVGPGEDEEIEFP